MVSILSGFKTIRHVIASTSINSILTSGNSSAISLAMASHSTRPFLCAFDFVTTVNNFLGLRWAV
jgi:hypothetical protein